MILKTLKKYLTKHSNTPLVIAYSGGVDSQVLLHAIAQLKQQNHLSQEILAIHVNHGLSPFAKQWQDFTKQQCKTLGINYQTVNVEIEQKPRISLEAQARDKRYHALSELSPDNAILLTGHHQDDQVETFFLSLKRGSGLKGLSAMAVSSTFGDKSQQLTRPFLNTSRKDIVQYAQENNLEWIEDESNKNIVFDRNFLRKDILPKLNARWANFDQTVMRSIQHCQDAQTILDEVAEQDLAHCLIESSIVDITALMALSLARFNQVVRFFINQHHQLMPSQQQLLQLRQQLLSAGKDKNPAVKLGDIWFRRYQNKLYLTPDFKSVAQWEESFTLSEEQKNIKLPDLLGELLINKADKSLASQYTILMSIPSHIDNIAIKFSHDNPQCQPEYRQHSRSLKKVLQELNIPPWQRKRLPMLYVNNELAAVIGLFVCQPFLENVHQQKITIHWHKNSG
ncbi:tRNA lysidine(34) synthetase TilS [Colwelliaceae bacterium 6441]